MRAQYQPLFLHVAVHVGLLYHRTLLRRLLLFHRNARFRFAHWVLSRRYLYRPSLLLPSSCRFSDDVSPTRLFTSYAYESLTFNDSAWTVEGRNHFRRAGQTANLGAYGYGFTWAPVACYFIALVLFCSGGTASRKDGTYQKKSYFGRKRSTRSRGSFIDSESQRRVRDEYA